MDKMKNLQIRIRILTFSLLLIISVSCGKNSNDQPKGEDKQTVPVKVTVVEKNNISQEKTFSGALEGVQQTSIVAKISERVVSTNFSVNSYVKKGQVIVQLDKTGPSSNYLQTKANFENVARDYERMKALLDEGAISQQILDQTKTAYEVSNANFEASKSLVELTAPINGILTDLKVNPGDWVAPGSELAVIANIYEMIINFYINERELQKLKIGDPVNIYSEFDNNKSVMGKIAEISRSADSDTRSFQVKAKFKNLFNHWYKPGMYVNVSVVLESQKDVLIIPAQSVISNNNINTVYVIRENKAMPLNINTGLSTDKYVVVLSGLNAGDTVVTVGMNNLKENSQVTIVN